MLAITLCTLGALARPQRATPDPVRPIRVLREIRLAPGARGVANDTAAWSSSWIGDLDGNGTGDLALGSVFLPPDDYAEESVQVLLMAPDGTVANTRKILAADLGDVGFNVGDYFGYSVAGLGDVNGDGVLDLAIGAPGEDFFGSLGAARGAIYVVFLNPDGTVRGHQRIDDENGGLQERLNDNSFFGFSLAPLGDLDGDGVPDLAVGARGHGFGGNGTVFILFLDADGSVRAEQRIAYGVGGFTGNPDAFGFGWRTTCVGDLDGDGVQDLAVGVAASHTVWTLLLRRDGTVKHETEIGFRRGGFTGELDPDYEFDRFGTEALSPLGDLDRDGVPDLAVGAPWDQGGSPYHGAIWILYLDHRGRVRGQSEISALEGGFLGFPDTRYLGLYSSPVDRDWNGDGRRDLLVGSLGATWILELDDQRGVAPEARVLKGSGVDRDCLASSTAPLAGGTWTATVHARPHATIAGLVATFDPLVPPAKLGTGELLIDLVGGPTLFSVMRPAVAGETRFDVPLLPELYGKHVYVQGYVLGGTSVELCNALELVIGNGSSGR